MKLFITIFLILFAGFWGLKLSYPSRWFKWNEWQEHIKKNHVKNILR